MKRIAFSNIDGGISILTPVEGARLFHSIRTKDGKTITVKTPMPVDSAFGKWPIDGAIVEWAETEDEFVSRIRAKDMSSDADITIIDDVSIDRTFRAAWSLVSSQIAIDMPRAKEIQKNRMRIARAPLLAALDIEYQRADEIGDAALKTDIAKRKQVLRDITADPAIEAAETPEELKAVWPEALSMVGENSKSPATPEKL